MDEFPVGDLKPHPRVVGVEPLANVGNAFGTIVNTTPVIWAERMRFAVQDVPVRVPNPERVLRAAVR